MIGGGRGEKGKVWGGEVRGEEIRLKNKHRFGRSGSNSLTRTCQPLERANLVQRASPNILARCDAISIERAQSF
jgi:hypothetical protein